MLYLLLKAALSGIIIAAASEIARRNAGLGALVVSLPLLSVLSMIWLWHDTHDPERMADHVGATLWYIAPSLPMFALIPWLLRQGWGFWISLVSGCALTVLLYLAVVFAAKRFDIQL